MNYRSWLTIKFILAVLVVVLGANAIKSAERYLPDSGTLSYSIMASTALICLCYIFIEEQKLKKK